MSGQLELGIPRIVLPATLMPLHGAVLSDDEIYRYILTRVWDETLPPMVWVMLNPSIADATIDDPTVRKCIGFAKRHGYGGVIIVNLYAYRATNPSDMLSSRRLGHDIIGPDNDVWIRHALSIGAQRAHVGWGTRCRAQIITRVSRVATIAQEIGATLYCIGQNAQNEPYHPLMTAYQTPVTEWRP